MRRMMVLTGVVLGLLAWMASPVLAQDDAGKKEGAVYGYVVVGKHVEHRAIRHVEPGALTTATVVVPASERCEGDRMAYLTFGKTTRRVFLREEAVTTAKAAPSCVWGYRTFGKTVRRTMDCDAGLRRGPF